MSVELIRFHPSNNELLEALIRAYQEVFAGYPWFEDWPYDVVKEDILRDVTETTPCWLAVERDLGYTPVVYGFTWGFEISDEKLAEMTDPESVETLRAGCGNSRVAYQSELGVLESQRKQGIARELATLRNEDFLSLGLEVGVIRTKADPPSITYKWYQRIGYEIFYHYDDGSNGVLMARRLEGLEF